MGSLLVVGAASRSGALAVAGPDPRLVPLAEADPGGILAVADGHDLDEVGDRLLRDPPDELGRQAPVDGEDLRNDDLLVAPVVAAVLPVVPDMRKIARSVMSRSTIVARFSLG